VNAPRPSWRVRDAEEADAAGVARVHWDSWVATYAGVFPQAAFDAFPLPARERLWRETARAALDEPARRCRLLVAAAADEALLGFACVGPFRAHGGLQADPQVGELQAIYLRPDAQRRGIGSALWRAGAGWLAQAGFREMRLWVIAANPAVAFYAARGARKIASTVFDAHGTPLTEDCYSLALTGA
jgi:L-amino acid N-acyltransferase YncA